MRLSERELKTFWRLPPRAREVLARELHEPHSQEAVLEILRSPIPERAFAQAVARETYETLEDPLGLKDAGFGKRRKGLFHLHRKIKGAIKKTLSKVARHDPLYKKTYKMRAKIAKGVRKFAPLILTVVGAILAPFTGGLSLVAASIISAAYVARQKKLQADKARREAKKEAGAMQAEANTANAQVEREADNFYAENQSFFLTAGITPDKWKAMTLDQKIDTIQAGKDGKLPASPEAVQAVKDAQDAGVLPPSQPGQIVDPGKAVEPPPPTEAPAPSGGTPPAAEAPAAPEAPAPPAEAPPPGELPSSGQGSFTIDVEGKTVTQFPITDASALADAVDASTKPGDRFEIFDGGKSLGLKIRTDGGGYIAIPPGQAEKVKAMSHEEVLAMLERAKDKAEGKGVEAPPSFAKKEAAGGGGSVLPWVAGGAAALYYFAS